MKDYLRGVTTLNTVRLSGIFWSGLRLSGSYSELTVKNKIFVVLCFE